MENYNDTEPLNDFEALLRAERHDLDVDEVMIAARFAAAAHRAVGQRRKYDGRPYIVHPIEVATTLSRIGASATVIKAALNHDVVEDTNVELDEVRDALGGDVAVLVDEMTDKSKPSDGNRRVRKAIDRDRLAKASGGGQSIKLADLISNSESIVRHDPNFAVTYLAEKAELLDVLVLGDTELMRRARGLLESGLASINRA